MDVAGTKGTAMMAAMKSEQIMREERRAQTSRDELVERIARAVPADGTDEPWPALRLRRASSPTELGHGVSSPSFCVTAQGSKDVLLGDHRYRYDPSHYLIASATLPVTSRVVEASR